jgi:hypothetical protein
MVKRARCSPARSGATASCPRLPRVRLDPIGDGLSRKHRGTGCVNSGGMSRRCSPSSIKRWTCGRVTSSRSKSWPMALPRGSGVDPDRSRSLLGSQATATGCPCVPFGRPRGRTAPTSGDCLRHSDPSEPRRHRPARACRRAQCRSTLPSARSPRGEDDERSRISLSSASGRASESP